MKKKKRQRLEKAGWSIAGAREFLGLSEEEEGYIELKIALSQELQTQRAKAGLSQEALAERIGSSQSRVSKMEKADPTVTIDLLVRAMFAAGASRGDVARAIANRRSNSRSTG